MAKTKMHLAFDYSYSHLGGRWRLPGGWPGRTFPDVTMYEDMARTAERGCLDMVFSGDGTGVPDTWQGSRDGAIEWGMNWPRQDLNPITVAMSRVTQRLGYGLTYSSTFMHPYYVARLMNSLDHVTAGRIAMNLVTSTRLSDAANYGFDGLMDHSARYDRMEEFAEVCRKLWDATEADAMLWDHATGRVGDPAKIHAMRHEGRYFKVEGPLNTPPSPQGRPVIIQAGGSPRGIRAAAAIVDIAFGGEMPLPAQVAQRQALDAALRECGRDPADVGMLWQTPIVVRETTAAAVAHRELLLTAIPPEAVGVYLSYNAGYDFSTLPERFTLGELQAAIVAAHASPVGFVYLLGQRLGMEQSITRAEFFEHGLREATHYDATIAGSAEDMADLLEERFDAIGGPGGFMLGHIVTLPTDLEAIAGLLVPELQRRGRFRSEYRYATLRDNLLDS